MWYPKYTCSILRRQIGFQTSWGGVYEATTDMTGNYTILLPPGTYAINNDFGYVLAAGPREVTVETGATIHLDLTFRFG